MPILTRTTLSFFPFVVFSYQQIRFFLMLLLPVADRLIAGNDKRKERKSGPTAQKEGRR
jgi:hypothetical protein